MIKFNCYGGVEDIGGNKILVKFDNTSIFFDFGLSYSKESLFFEEILQPRSGCKIHDLFKLGLLPHLDGLYRQDAIFPRDFESYPAKAKKLWNLDIQSFEQAKKNGSWHPD